MKEYKGIFAELLADFVAFKRSLGFKYQTEAEELGRFAQFTLSFNLQQPILTPKIVQAWTAERVIEGDRNQARRAYLIRQFALYLSTMGHEAYVAVPPKKTRDYTFVPYIFTPSELERLFAQSDRLYPLRRSTLPQVMPVVLRLLYSSGLRISEALNLTNHDVNLQDGILEIKNSKFGKDRIVPMSDSMLAVCRQYARTVHQQSSEEDYFFMHADGDPISRDNVYRRFREILWESGIPHGGRGKGPRLHDLRHSYAVYALKAAVDRHIDVYAALPVLSAYLGHTSITATEQYVRLTADCYPEIRAALDRACGWVIPEVAWE